MESRAFPYQPSLELVTAPTEKPIDVDSVKTYLRVDEDSEDDLIQLMIDATTTQVEDYLGLKLITQQWNIWYDEFPFAERNIWWDGIKEVSRNILVSETRSLMLPLGKLISVDEFVTYDNSDVQYAFANSNFSTDNAGLRGRIALRIGQVWPTTILRGNNGIRIKCTFGFGASAASVPADIKFAMNHIIAQMYENRGDDAMKIPPSALTLLEKYRRFKVAL